MEGQIKWFSREKGYGFVTSQDGEDHFFAVQDVRGADLPAIGDTVRFEGFVAPRGRRARDVQILRRSSKDDSRPPAAARDDRVRCPRCGKHMVPRIITDRGALSHSVCPFCGGTFKSFRWCFIATAVYGDVNSPQVILLREFRDRRLCRTIVGRMFVACYYWLSPSLAAFLVRRAWAARATRMVLDHIVDHLKTRTIAISGPREIGRMEEG
jgi:cold shock CspA family protein